MRLESSFGARGASAPATLRSLCLGLLTAISAGCGEPTQPAAAGGGSADHRSLLVVSGSILDSEGAGIYRSIVRVTVYEYQDGCSNAPIGRAFEATVNEVGDYLVNLTFDRDEFDACLTVEAIPPAGSGFLTETNQATDVDVNELANGIGVVQMHFVLERP